VLDCLQSHIADFAAGLRASQGLLTLTAQAADAAAWIGGGVGRRVHRSHRSSH
jgi:hypothetical protein